MKNKTRAFTGAVLLALCCAFPCRAAPLQRLEAGPFCFLFPPAEKKAARFIAGQARPAADRICSITGFSLPARVSVTIVSSREQFNRAQPEGTYIPDWAVGVAYPAHNSMILLHKERVDLLKTFRHELSHIILGNAFGAKHRIPRWLDEGLAIIFADEWTLSRLSTLTFAALTDSLLPMDEIAKSFPVDLRKARIAYCQSFYFISFLKGEFGADTFKSFLESYSRHRDFRRAVQSTYHMSWHRMEDRWLRYVHLRFSWIPLLTSSGFLWFVASIVFIVCYVHKKRKTRQRLLDWEQQETLREQPDADPPPPAFQ
jgi:hypothetical protein